MSSQHGEDWGIAYVHKSVLLRLTASWSLHEDPDERPSAKDLCDIVLQWRIGQVGEMQEARKSKEQQRIKEGQQSNENGHVLHGDQSWSSAVRCLMLFQQCWCRLCQAAACLTDANQKFLAFFCLLDRIHVSSAVFHCEDITCIALQAQLASANTFLLITWTDCHSVLMIFWISTICYHWWRSCVVRTTTSQLPCGHCGVVITNQLDLIESGLSSDWRTNSVLYFGDIFGSCSMGSHAESDDIGCLPCEIELKPYPTSRSVAQHHSAICVPTVRLCHVALPTIIGRLNGTYR